MVSKHRTYDAVSPTTGKPVRVMEYDNENFLVSCVEAYKKLAGVTKLRKASTPFIQEQPDHDDGLPEFVRRKMEGKRAAKPKDTDDEDVSGSEPIEGRPLNGEASKILMKVLYGARMARYDFLKAVNTLAALVTKWDPVCDKKLYRLMCYINSTLKLRMVSWVGDDKNDLGPHLYADADSAGDSKTMRSTSGVFLSILGPNSSCPLSGRSSKQTAVSHSTPEAEIVAADLAVRTEGLLAIELWSLLLGRDLRIIFHEDNQAMIAVCKSGRKPTMRHLNRTHKVDVAWLHERFISEDYELRYKESNRKAAYIFTKGFTDAD